MRNDAREFDRDAVAVARVTRAFFSCGVLKVGVGIKVSDYIFFNHPVWERLLEKKGQVETFRQISSMM